MDLIGLLSLFLIPAGFIEGLHPYVRYPSFIIGIVIITLYLKNNYDSKIQNLRKEISLLKQENRKMMENLKEKTSKLEGWKEAVEHFWMNKKAQIDPYILIIIIIIIVALVVLVQKLS